MLLATLLWACLWDSDTIRAEAKGLPEVLQIITGRFERNPPLYYEMRLARAAARITAEPDDLEAYDDAGVSADRLGRGDEAIAWMGRKAERLDAMERSGIDAARVKDHRYRYLANLGTFHIHRWVRAGGDREDLADAERARELIRAAIEMNPDAHFGREKYQLMAIEWLIDPTQEDRFAEPGWLMIPERELRDHPREAVRGLTGLIALGNAWESVDVFAVLIRALEQDGDRNVLATLAWRRATELVGEGKRSLHPQASFLPSPRTPPTLYKPDELEDQFQFLRREAEDWHAARTAYMMERLEAGRHPDTDPEFWADFHDDGPPRLRKPVSIFTIILTAIGAALAAVVAGIVWLLVRRWRRNRPVEAIVITGEELARGGDL